MNSPEKKFVAIFLFALALVLTVFVACVVWLLQGAPGTDYGKLTKTPQKSLILGTSYSAQGVVPSELNSSDLVFEGPIYNFAFTNSTAQWGPAYYRAIQLMVDPSTRNGLFLLQSNPRGFKVTKSERELGEAGFSELNSFVGRIEEIRSKGSLDYLLNWSNEPLWKIFWDRIRPQTVTLQDDGWLKVDLHRSSEALARAIRQKYAAYAKELKGGEFSEERWAWFQKTVAFLDEHGTVVFLRLPSTDGHAALEDKFAPELDARIEALAEKLGTTYLNYKGTYKDYLTNDGAHLNQKSAKRFSAELAKALKPVLH